jgi:hypothetical protein
MLCQDANPGRRGGKPATNQPVVVPTDLSRPNIVYLVLCMDMKNDLLLRENIHYRCLKREWLRINLVPRRMINEEVWDVA